MLIEQKRIVIEGVTPQVDGGRFAAKAVVGDEIEIGADIYKDGHEHLRAAVLMRPLSKQEIAPGSWGRSGPRFDRKNWQWTAMREMPNDRWTCRVLVDRIGGWAFTVVAWTDRFGSWQEELRKKAEAGQDVTSELLEGIAIIRAAMKSAGGQARGSLETYVKKLNGRGAQPGRVKAALSRKLTALMEHNDPRQDILLHHTEIPLWVDRERARYGSWYEIFVRSQGTDSSKSATFRDAGKRLPYIAGMGFDVLYLTPIHPIGESFRKGPNNTEKCLPGDPGSPWAIGNRSGGHMSVHPDLGTIGDYDRFSAKAKKLGMEIAIDFAIQCSPDHPWVSKHPEWFSHRPDGTIKYAENPPKKYQDIYPIDFDTRDREGLYRALRGVVKFWITHGVKIFRVDNPHTKPIEFWEWLISSIHRDHPDVLFLAEAFTRPKRMKMLAKVGFSQSYTYFTWRNNRRELEKYATELFATDVRDYFRPNFFANTPDILHAYLQEGGRPAFIARLVLAATLSPTYGIYSGFELCENTPVRPGSEEYADSEKYQYKVWDWDRVGNVRELVTTVNRIRHKNPSLQRGDTLQILESTNPNIIAYAKATRDLDNVLVVVVNLDSFAAHDGTVRVPPKLFGGTDSDSYTVRDLLSGDEFQWRGQWNYVKLDPAAMPAHILRLKRLSA